MPEKTEEEFTSYAHARRWFKTGDIGEFQGRRRFTFADIYLIVTNFKVSSKSRIVKHK